MTSTALLLWGVLLLFVILLIFTPLSRSFSKAGHRLLGGVWRAGDNIEDSIERVQVTATSSKRSLYESNEKLRSEILEIRGTLLDYNRVVQENEELSELLNVQSDEKVVVTARVLARPSHSSYDTLVIQGGSFAGIEVGDLATAFGSVLLGEVTEVFKTTSKVKVFSGSGVSRDTMFAGDNRNISITGRGGGNFSIELPRDIEVVRGTEVFDVPTGKLLASVQAIIFDPREPFQTILLRSPINLRNLKWVQVVRVPDYFFPLNKNNDE